MQDHFEEKEHYTFGMLWVSNSSDASVQVEKPIFLDLAHNGVAFATNDEVDFELEERIIAPALDLDL